MSKLIPVQPFQLPLTRAEFSRALQAGLGRAVLHAQSVDSPDYSDIVLDACTHNRAYDPQCEGDRADWMMLISDALQMRHAVRDAVLKRLASNYTLDDFWHIQQCCRLACTFAQHGDADARRALYKCFRKWPNSSDVIAARDIIALDGSDGLVFVADQLGSSLRTDASFWVDDELLNFYDEIHGTGAALRHLQSAAADRANIRAYLDAIHRPLVAETGTHEIPILRKGKASTQSTSHPDAQSIIRDIQTEAPDIHRYLYASWGFRASNDQLQSIAEALFHENDTCRLQNFLRIFSRREMPSFDPRLLNLTRHPDEEVRTLAFRALSHLHHPAIRNLALTCVARREFSEEQLRLFRHNYAGGDHLAIERSLVLPEDLDARHSLISGLSVAFENCTHAEIGNLLVFVYEYSPCGNCREPAVETLQKMGSIPAWISTECAHDAVASIHKIPPASTPI